MGVKNVTPLSSLTVSDGSSEKICYWGQNNDDRETPLPQIYYYIFPSALLGKKLVSKELYLFCHLVHGFSQGVKKTPKDWEVEKVTILNWKFLIQWKVQRFLNFLPVFYLIMWLMKSTNFNLHKANIYGFFWKIAVMKFA